MQDLNPIEAAAAVLQSLSKNPDLSAEQVAAIELCARCSLRYAVLRGCESATAAVALFDENGKPIIEHGEPAVLSGQGLDAALDLELPTVETQTVEDSEAG